MALKVADNCTFEAMTEASARISNLIIMRPASIFSLMDGEDCETSWKGSFPVYKLTSSSRIRVKLQVNNTLVEKKLLNVFGVIQGIEEAGKDPQLEPLAAYRDSKQ